MALVAGMRLGRYEIGLLIGAGGMGEVYRARDPKLGRDVAVKVLPEHDGARLRRFEKEARAAAELEHPNIIAVHDVGVDGSVAYIVTELLEGTTLAEALRHGPLPRAQAIEIAIQVARGVAAAHDKGLLHRDLKPANVFLCRDGRVKILDFGLAAHVAGEAPRGDASTVTESGAILGTPAYMSPEQVRGKRVDARGDVFALGAILYEMLAGRRPFLGEGAVEVGHAILSDEPPPLDDPAIDAIIKLCLAKDPAARLRSADDLALLLDSLPPVRAAALPPRRRWWPLAAGGALAVAAAAAWIARPAPSAHDAPRYARVTFRDRLPGRARFAPDGRSVIYEAASHREPPRIFLSVPGQPEAQPLSEPGTSLVDVSATGELLVKLRRDGKQVIARVAVGGGTPRVLYDDVEDAAFAPDGAAVALVRAVGGGQRRLEYPPGHVLFTTVALIDSPRVSPRGDMLAFRERRDMTPEDAPGSIVLLDTSGARRIASRPFAEVSGLAWTPDGDEVWTGGRRGAFRSIHALARDGGERKVLELPAWLSVDDIARDGRLLLDVFDARFGIAALMPGQTVETLLGWYDQSIVQDLTPDGRLLLFAECGEAHQERCQAYARATDGSPAVHLGPEVGFALSPDGAWMLGADQADLTSISLVPVGAGERRPLPRGPIVRYGWGKFFAGGDRIAVVAGEANHALRVWIQDLAGGDPRPISDEGIDYLARPLADGSAVPACRADGSCSLYPVSGGAPRPLPMPRRPGRLLQMTPDGKALIFLADEKPSSLWLVDLATGSERLLRELPNDPRLGMGSLALTPDAQTIAYTYWRTQADVYVVQGLH